MRRASWNTSSSDHRGLVFCSSPATRLCWRIQIVWMVVRPGCSFTRDSPVERKKGREKVHLMECSEQHISFPFLSYEKIGLNSPSNDRIHEWIFIQMTLKQDGFLLDIVMLRDGFTLGNICRNCITDPRDKTAVWVEIMVA